ncbi:rhomboid family intramembrane serine protease [uncultured Polaribacter sp.]|uniref:rhomboid family intramembrane serine protease n=1 Tax=uncultured Polaribacter sp. TaxID=174711 RepID=UPI002617B2B6|nr:rhomboid family intramembrane serine protease [uncultured Polaribacter sp.]
MSFKNNLLSKYKNGSIVEKLIYINILVFVVTLLTSVFKDLFKVENNFIVSWFALEDNLDSLILKPWSIVSYGFLHADFVHLLLNLITLYFIGNLFIEYFKQKQLITFYLVGTFFGGLVFLISHNYFPLFQGQNSTLVGASAGISAIFIGIATYIPNYQLKIRFIGFVKLWYLALIWVVLDVLALSGSNAGGHFAHLGGALFGFLYVKKATDNNTSIWETFISFITPKKTALKTVYKSKKKKQKSTKNTNLNQQQINTILDKISASGYDTLTKEEKEFLFKQGK